MDEDDYREMRGPLWVERFYDRVFGMPRHYGRTHKGWARWFWRALAWPEHRFFCHFCHGAREVLRELKVGKA